MTTPISPLLSRLLSHANPDGGFGAHDGLPSTTEPTALALVALARDDDPRPAAAAERARAWLLGAQTPEGGWPAAPGFTTPSWTTSLGVLACASAAPTLPAATRGGRWLLTQEGGQPPRSRSFADWMLGRETAVVVDASLVGWPWVEGTFSWVEPTAYAVLALEAVRGSLPANDVERRLALARRMLVDRRCKGGGWNYGNSRVLGEELWPYPDTTALALLALRPGADETTMRESLDALGRMLEEDASGLATALGIIALAAYGRDVRELRTRLRERFARTAFLGETRALAYALMALDPRGPALGGVPGA